MRRRCCWLKGPRLGLLRHPKMVAVLLLLLLLLMVAVVVALSCVFLWVAGCVRRHMQASLQQRDIRMSMAHTCTAI